jgi:hypothetical protein
MDFEVMERLFQKGYIFDPRGKTKSVVLASEELLRVKRLFCEIFGKQGKETAAGKYVRKCCTRD